MAEQVTPQYPGKAADASTACKTVITNATPYLPELVVYNAKWTNEWADAMQLRINTAIIDHLGLDPKKAVRIITQELLTLVKRIQRSAAIFKVMVSAEMGDQAPSILQNVGYGPIIRLVQAGDQEAITQFTATFKNGMTTELRDTLCTAGINPLFIQQLLTDADEFLLKETAQEAAKLSQHTITAAGITEINAIYSEVISLCKVAVVHFADSPEIQKQFVFSRIMANMNAAAFNPTPVVDEEPGNEEPVE